MLNDAADEFAIQGWSDSTLRLAVRTGFRCEYCGSDFFASLENYYAFEVEHIVPRGRGAELDDSPENLTVACRTCNRLKRRWDPRTQAGEGAGRAKLIEAARGYVSAQRKEKLERILGERERALSILARMVNGASGVG